MSELDPAKVSRAQAAFASVPYAKFLGLELGELTSGQVSIRLPVRPELMNQRVVHGGVIASLVDTAAAFAVLTQIALDEKVTTTDLTIHYLRPIVSGSMTATARVVRGGRRLFVLSVEVLSDQDILLATAVTTYIKV